MAHPVISGGGPRRPYPVIQLSSQVHCDPVKALGDMLETGITPEQIWPARSDGHQVMLHSPLKPKAPRDSEQPLLPACSENSPAKTRRLQEILRKRLAHDPTAPQTAIRAHKDCADLIFQAQNVICSFDWFHDPTKAVFVCADQCEASEIEALLRKDNVEGRNEDLLESAQILAEGLMAPFILEKGIIAPSPGWRYSGPGPVVVASEISPTASWREVFLSPGCRGLQARELLPAVRAAQIGIHLVRA